MQFTLGLSIGCIIGRFNVFENKLPNYSIVLSDRKQQMDTYVHMAVGGALGTLLTEICESRLNYDELNLTDSKRIVQSSFISCATVSLLAGIIAHGMMDALPHGDYLVQHGLVIPNSLWPLRELIAGIATAFYISQVTSGRRRIMALAGLLGGGLPDLESLLIGLDFLSQENALLPTHNGMVPHGRNIGWPSLVIELGILILSLWVLWSFRNANAMPTRGV